MEPGASSPALKSHLPITLIPPLAGTAADCRVRHGLSRECLKNKRFVSLKWEEEEEEEELAIPGKACLDLSTFQAIFSCDLLPVHPNITGVVEGGLDPQEGGAKRAKRWQSTENLVGRKDGSSLAIPRVSIVARVQQDSV